MLALERAAVDLPPSEPAEPATTSEPASTDAATVAAHRDDEDRRRRTLERGIERRRERTRVALRDVKRALADGDLVAAGGALAAARDLAAPLADPGLLAWVTLFESELAAAAGDVAAAARRSCAAEQLARRAQDPSTYLAVWWLRAARALRRGDGGAGELMARWMDPWLADASPRARARLRCFAAAFALDDDRADRAIELAAAVVGSAPGTAEAALAGAIVAQAFLALDRPTDAARIATSSIERCPGVPARIAARLYLDAAAALDAAGAAELAARADALAHRLDPDITRAISPADLARAGLELRVL